MDHPPTKLRIALAGGGSGGHIYPNLAVLESLEEQLGPEQVGSVFLVSARPIDRAILDAERRTSAIVPASPVALRPRALARLVTGWGGAVRAARSAIREHRADVVLATGGFVSAPVMFAARAERVPLVLLNLDAVAGKANRWVARHAALRLTSADDPGLPQDWERVRPVVRRGAVSSASPDECRIRLGLHPGLPTLLITGGSQGARSINRLIGTLVEAQPRTFDGWQILHQCGEDAAPTQQAIYDRAGIPALCVEFLSDMASAWGAASLAVARCGAGSVAEVWASAVPSVLLPYPYHRDQHQAANARPLVEAGAVILEQDRIDPEQNAEAAGLHILSLLTDAPSRERMQASFAGLGPTDGADAVARHILLLLK